jgi:hypothetical protein
MAPLPPAVKNAKAAWDKVEEAMGWFTDLVTTGYGWTDALIKSRQNKANKEYKIAKAEKEAFRIMMAQAAREKGQDGKARKRDVNWFDSRFDDEREVDDNFDAFYEFLETSDLE